MLAAKRNYLISASLLFLSGCFEKSAKTTVFIPEGAVFLGKRIPGTTELKDVRIDYIWYDGQSIQVKSCLTPIKTHFDWDNYRLKGYIRNLDCYGNYPVDAVMYDRDEELGILPSYDGPIAFRSVYPLDFPSDKVKSYMKNSPKTSISDLINTYEDQDA